MFLVLFIGGFDLWVVCDWAVLVWFCGFCFGGLELFVLCFKVG